MRDEEFAANGAGIALALIVVAQMDVDGFGLTLHDEKGRLPGRFGLGRGVDNNVRLWAAAPVLGPLFLSHLFERVAVVVVQVQDELLTHALLGGGFQPFLAQGAEYLVASDLNLIRLGVWFRCLGHGVSYAS